MVALERDNLELMLSGVGRARFVAPDAAITAWAALHSLSEEQATALVQTLGSTDWTVAIEGRAGSAKTTTVGALRDFVAARGYRVAGFGPTTGSVRALGEAGVAARTVAALLANRADTDATPHTLWIVDESSLLASRQVNKLLHRARELDVEKVIFVGDQGQHHAVEAGRPILQMERAGLRTARLETIRRQRDRNCARLWRWLLRNTRPRPSHCSIGRAAWPKSAVGKSVNRRSRVNISRANAPARARWW